MFLISTPRNNFNSILILVTRIGIMISIYPWIRKKESLPIFLISLSISGTLYSFTTSIKITRGNFGLSTTLKSVWICSMLQSSQKFFQKTIEEATNRLSKKNKS